MWGTLWCLWVGLEGGTSARGEAEGLGTEVEQRRTLEPGMRRQRGEVDLLGDSKTMRGVSSERALTGASIQRAGAGPIRQVRVSVRGT